jgi:glycosyltransferase involved in cell wall biosynthesis
MIDEQMIILTIAYNAETTIARAMDSILKQSYKNWIYYVFDNGSTDNTREIIERYSAGDRRIIAMNQCDNDIWAFFDLLPQIIDKHNDNSWFCTLDADDEYELTAFVEMLAFAEDNSLDIVGCGNSFIDAQTNEISSTRKPYGNTVIADTGFGEMFVYYHQYLRAIWAKLYRITLLRKIRLDVDIYKNMGYGGDTYFVLNAMKHANRFGVVENVLYKYYHSQKSISNTFNNKRIASDHILHISAFDFLISKVDRVSLRNEEFLLIIYMNAISDTLVVLLNSDIPEPEKINGVIDIFSHEHTKQLATCLNFGALNGDAPGQTKRRRELFAVVAQLLRTREEVPDNQIEAFCAVGEFVCAACENADGWLFFKKLLARFLLNVGRLDEARPKLDELAELLPDDGEWLPSL